MITFFAGTRPHILVSIICLYAAKSHSSSSSRMGWRLWSTSNRHSIKPRHKQQYHYSIMLFPCIRMVCVSLLLTGSTYAMTSEQLMSNIENLSRLSGTLQSILDGVTTLASPSAVQTNGQVVFLGTLPCLMLITCCAKFQVVNNVLDTFVVDLNKDIGALQASSPCSDADAQAIVTSFSDVSRIADGRVFAVLTSFSLGKKCSMFFPRLSKSALFLLSSAPHRLSRPTLGFLGRALMYVRLYCQSAIVTTTAPVIRLCHRSVGSESHRPGRYTG
jgi:hypothetical protein